MPTKQFSVAKLVIGNSAFNLQNFSALSPQYHEQFTDNDGNKHDKLIETSVLRNQFLSLYFEAWKALPRPDSVYNINKESDEKNPRSPNQIERDTQIFVLIQESTQKIFISDFRIKLTIEDWLKEKIKEDVKIKNIIDKDNFVNEIQSLNSVYLSASPDLFSLHSGILSEQLNQDIHNYGLDIEHIELKIQFQKHGITERAQEQIRKLFQQHANRKFSKLEISGRHDEKFDRIFNTDNIIDKIEIEAIRRPNDGLLDPSSIFNALIDKIQ